VRDVSTPDEQGACPICGASTKFNRRYPHQLCLSCSTRTTDIDGRPVRVHNVTIHQTGTLAHYSDGSRAPLETAGGKLESMIYVVYVDGVRCLAQAAWAGGIQIQPEHAPVPHSRTRTV
jgi:hypothetical protein